MSLKKQIETIAGPAFRLLPLTLRLPLLRWWHGYGLLAPPVRGETAENHADTVPPEPPGPTPEAIYARRVQEEVERFAEDEQVHDLPRIFDYWSNTYLRPLFESFGFSYPEDFFARSIEQQARALGRPLRIVSIGAGNCDCELVVARLLCERGINGFRIECLDITQAMLERGRALADEAGLGQHFAFVNADFNRWQPDGHYDVVIANQSLHHVVELEALFDAVAQAIGDDGIFITSDMIGRNGHMRWPEALEIVQEYWQELPEPYRYNVQLRRHEAEFGNWDCSAEGFEGIRAQDILPLALQRFGFDLFIGYGNLIDPFIDRGFGPHFDPQRDADRELIDRIHARDEAEMLAGRIKPTHMLAVMRRDRSAVPQVWKHLTPSFCLRQPDSA